MTCTHTITNAHIAETTVVNERPMCIRVAKHGKGQPDIGGAGGIPE